MKSLFSARRPAFGAGLMSENVLARRVPKGSPSQNNFVELLLEPGALRLACQMASPTTTARTTTALSTIDKSGMSPSTSFRIIRKLPYPGTIYQRTKTPLAKPVLRIGSNHQLPGEPVALSHPNCISGGSVTLFAKLPIFAQVPPTPPGFRLSKP